MERGGGGDGERERMRERDGAFRCTIVIDESGV